MRIALASILTAVALFFFGFLWWGILMPIIKPATVLAEGDLVEAMGTALPSDGLYFYPDYAEPPESGPVAMIFYRDAVPDMGMTMGMGFGHMLITALIVCVVVSRLNLPTFGQRMGWVAFLGLFVAVWADAGNMVWWHHPPNWVAFHAAYDLLSWCVAGLIIAAIVVPKIKSDADQ